MFDRQLITAARQPLQKIASGLLASGITANQMTVAGFIAGLTAVPLIITGHTIWALLSILLNRLADGLDGTMARLTGPTDRGAFLDSVFDFLFYSAIPLAFAFAAPEQNALAAATLIYSFVGTGCSFLAFAVLAAKRGITSMEYPDKGFYYLGGLTEGTETILLFVVMCLFPAWFPVLAYGFAALCLLTIISRIATGIRIFTP
ncbi:CDP-alcohol phosphatidyltransferase family protein [Tolumonas osonensis]|uniref:Phosphatidylglycerophosphate synthase n=1 Tax=Tolumonas osonensis TaxID=675874 RepID=A0A841GFA6_9GAMM|nr:CDP-alcohol phosphatidyltransferase family protein [Tolumonas osonensis]MBB6056257.1 phosphatidylglycerophosphate synthase [Tolumonas osonensis]